MTSNCNGTYINKTPLYPTYLVTPDVAHLARGVEKASQITKLNIFGQPDTAGKIIEAFPGMSNWRQQILVYTATYPNRKIVQYNAGRGGWDLWKMAEGYPNDWWTWFEKKLNGTDPANPKKTFDQVQVIVFKNSLAKRRYGEHLPPIQHIAEYKRLANLFVKRAINTLPNLKLFFFTSPVYSGYAGASSPRIEPNVYFEGVAIDELIRENYGAAGPWIGWGPYLWADGINVRIDGTKWMCLDFVPTDGVHPSAAGKAKVAELVNKFHLNHPLMGWTR